MAENDWFQASPQGLPAGPTTVPDGDPTEKIQVPKALTAEDDWQYDHLLPYSSFATQGVESPGWLTDEAPSPYLGLGGLLQLNCSWFDLYGNGLVTSLTTPGTSTEPLNFAPLRVGYTDAVIALSQWPSVSAGYQIDTGPQLALTLSFDSGNYEPDADNDNDWQQQATNDLAVYTRIYYQLTDPNGISAYLETTLVPRQETLGAVQGMDVDVDLDTLEKLEVNLATLTAWLDTICGYLTARSQGETGTPPQALVIDETLTADQLNPNPIFPLYVYFIIERSSGEVAGELKATTGVSLAVSEIDPQSISLSNGSSASLALQAFAQSFSKALSGSGYSLQVATGADSAQYLGKQSGTLWAVCLGASPAGRGISYSVSNPGAPLIFALRPISNTLQSRSGVPIYDYTSTDGISATPTRTLYFSDVDMDVWGRLLTGGGGGGAVAAIPGGNSARGQEPVHHLYG